MKMSRGKKSSAANIVILGSSTSWTPTLATDLMLTLEEPLEFRLVDINPEPARLCAEWGSLAAKHLGRCRWKCFL
jgi:hypothetical protein